MCATVDQDELVQYRIKECCTQIHALIQKWKKLSVEGFDAMNKFTNLIILNRYVITSKWSVLNGFYMYILYY